MDLTWHEKRRLGIGGSDWGNVLSVEPYGCRKKFWLEKVGVEPDADRIETGAMRRGHRLEPLVVDEFLNRNDAEAVNDPSAFLAEGNPEWLIGSTDLLVSIDGSPSVLECKTARPEVFRKVVEEGPFVTWIMQVHHYMLLTGLRVAYIAVIEPLNWVYAQFEVAFDEELAGKMLEAGSEVWNEVQFSEEPPEKLPTYSRPCDRCEYSGGCWGGGEMVPGDIEVIDSEQLAYLLARYVEMRATAGEIKKDMDGLRAEIKEALGDPGEFLCDGRKVSWSRAMRRTFDRKRFEEDSPQLAVQYIIEKPSEALRIG